MAYIPRHRLSSTEAGEGESSRVLAVELLVVAALAGLGALLTRALLEAPAPVDFLSLSLPLGGGVLTWTLFLMSLAQIPLVRTSVTLTYLLLVVGMTIYGVRRGRWGRANRQAEPRSQRMGLAPLILVLCCALLLVSSALAVGRSYSRFDAMAGWSVKGYGIALEGSVAAADRWGTWGRAYPLNLPLQISLFWMFGGDELPGSKLLFPLTFVSLLAGIYRFWRTQGVGAKLASLGVLFLLTNPLAYLHSTLGVANLPFAAYLTLGSLWLSQGVFRDNARHRWVGGSLLTIAIWTRAEGIAYCLAILVGLWLAVRLLKAGQLSRPLWLIPLAAVTLSWFGFSLVGVAESHLGSAVGDFFERLLAGQFNARYLGEIIRLYAVRGISPGNLGFLFPVLALLLGFGLWRLRPLRDPLGAALLGIAAIAAAVPVGLFYVRSFTRWTDFTDLLTRSFDRATLPAIFLTVTTAILLLGERQEVGSDASDRSTQRDLAFP